MWILGHEQVNKLFSFISKQKHRARVFKDNIILKVQMSKQFISVIKGGNFLCVSKMRSRTQAPTLIMLSHRVLFVNIPANTNKQILLKNSMEA